MHCHNFFSKPIITRPAGISLFASFSISFLAFRRSALVGVSCNPPQLWFSHCSVMSCPNVSLYPFILFATSLEIDLALLCAAAPLFASLVLWIFPANLKAIGDTVFFGVVVALTGNAVCNAGNLCAHAYQSLTLCDNCCSRGSFFSPCFRFKLRHEGVPLLCSCRPSSAEHFHEIRAIARMQNKSAALSNRCCGVLPVFA